MITPILFNMAEDYWDNADSQEVVDKADTLVLRARDDMVLSCHPEERSDEGSPEPTGRFFAALRMTMGRSE